MTSTSSIMGTGFMKCIPITCSGRLVADAIWVMEMEEVLVARMVPGWQISSKRWKSPNLVSSFSVAASMAKSTVAAPVSREVWVEILARVAAFLAWSMVPLANKRSRFLPIVDIPPSREAWEISIRLTLNPFWAKTWAIPFPMVPAPMTAMCFIRFFFVATEPNGSDLRTVRASRSLFVERFYDLKGHLQGPGPMLQGHDRGAVVAYGI